MRTADELLDSWLPKDLDIRQCVIEAINEGRREILKECLCHYVQDGNPQVWRDKILSLLKEIQ